MTDENQTPADAGPGVADLQVVMAAHMRKHTLTMDDYPTRRDQYAIAALPVCVTFMVESVGDGVPLEDLAKALGCTQDTAAARGAARMAFAIADAMLIEREAKH